MKTQRINRLLSLFLALLLCVSTLPGVAYASVDSSERFSAYIPENLSVVIDSNGNVHVPSGEAARIYNATKTRSIVVSEIIVSMQNGWYAESWTANYDNMPVNEKAFGLKLRDDALSADGSFSITNPNWIVPASSYIDLGMQVKVAKQTIKRNSEVVAKIGFKFDWADSDTNKKQVFKISFEDRDGGKIANLTPVYTDENGTVPRLPDTNADSEHKFLHYEDETGRLIFSGDKIESDIILHPIFETIQSEEPEPIKKPIVRFENGDNGSVNDKTPIEAPDSIVPELPGVTPDDGFKFDHWEDENGNPVQPGDAIDNDITLHPVFEEKKPVYPVIRFEDGDNGSVDNKTPIEVTNGIVPELPSVTSNNGFEQIGWEDENGNPVQPGDAIDHDITLHPVFEEKKPVYPVIRFEDGDNGSVDNKTPIEVTNGIVPELPSVTSNDGFEQIGWKDENGNPVQPGDAIDHDITLHPVFEEKKPVYPVIRFEDGDNGSVDNKTPIEVTNGIVPELPSVTSNDSFEQIGWEDENGNPVQPGDAIDHDITLHPVFEEKKPVYPVIRFEDGDNGSVDNKTPIEVTNGIVPELPGVTSNDGFEQIGWEDENGNPVQPGDAIDHDITLHPVFEEISVQDVVVSFTASKYNGTISGNTAPVTVKVGTKWSEIVTPDTNDGLSATFMGWYNGDTELTDDFVINEDMTATANFMSWFTHADVTIAFGSDLHAITGFSEAYEKAGRPSEIVIPNTIDGQSVTGISRGAFAEQTQLTSVEIQEGFKEFDQYVFYRCTNMTKCNIPESLTDLGAYAFKESGISGDVYLSDNLVSCGGSVFSHCDNLESLSIPGRVNMSGTTEPFIPYGFAEYCSNLRKAEIREGATKTMVGVFRGCKALTDLVLPSSLVEIQNYFVGSSGDDTHCENLKWIHYRGTWSQWNRIKVTYDNSILVAGNNAMLKKADVGCNWFGDFKDL